MRLNSAEFNRNRPFDWSARIGKILNRVGKNLFRETKDFAAVPEISRENPPTMYIHIPFCHAPLCEMCPFFRVEFSQVLAKKYVKGLRNELQRYRENHFTHVYIGGGTPATIIPELVELIREFNLGSQELSVEAHPSDLTEHNLTLLKSAGVTRLSVGIQSFNSALLTLMNRNNGKDPIGNIRRAVDSFNVNVDLIYNFAGQTVEQFVADLKILFMLGVPQITCYPLMAAPGEFSSVDDSNEGNYYRVLLDMCKEVGYSAITSWCFVKDEDSKQGEYITSQNGEEYLGLGASAISKIDSVFTINSFNLADYSNKVMHGERPVVGSKKLSIFEDAQYFILTSLFGMRLDLNEIKGSRRKKAIIKAEVMMLKKAKLVTIQEGVVIPTQEGMLFFSRAMKNFYTGLNFFREKHKKKALEQREKM